MLTDGELMAAVEPEVRAAEALVAAERPQAPSVFAAAQVVSIYGYPGAGTMGELGLHDAEQAADVAVRLAEEYDRVNGPRGAIPAFHLIVDVAQARPQSDGSYLAQMSIERAAVYVEVARERGLLVFLDLQIGWTDPLRGVQRLHRLLAEPFVHVALDPEFATEHRDRAPGDVIGALAASHVNAVQAYLARLVRWHDLPPKVLTLHQFLPEMLPDADAYDDVPEVEVTVDMDGFGGPGPKLAGYERYALAPYAERAAIKLFYHWDDPLILPADLLALERPPDYVIYQ